MSSNVVAPVIAIIIIGVLVTLHEVGYYTSHPRSHHSLTAVLLGLALVACQQVWRKP